ncbi:PREDICTED: uncharacterized protein LOC106788016 isoform X1 [Polistes canadensis]|uniref:uncharacterized protein LOC106788016 isoform X1 n=2 Tax=Polistes canadensis TaxID=91411 RepID=UPI000718C1B8|nr:PREDICTED: uncharacterized protein LOC106788016 isoform X1 [Polistes canadensis]
MVENINDMDSSNNQSTMSWSSAGRSRGRAKSIDIQLRRPGINSYSKYNQYVCTEIIAGIKKLTINERIQPEQINEIVNLVPTTKDEETLKNIFNTLYKHALEDRIFGIKLASLFSDVAFFSIEVNKNQNMRYLLLIALQNDYKRREEIKEESIILFRNVISLLGEVYYQMTLISGKPLKVLEIPLLDCWNMLLETATEEDIELVATQIIITGKGMYGRPELDQFMLNIRKTLTNNTLSSTAKEMLLLTIDLANQQFHLLPKILNDYYDSRLDPAVLIYFHRHNRELDINETDEEPTKTLTQKKNNVDQEFDTCSTSMLQPKQQETIQAENSEEKDYLVMDTLSLSYKKNFRTENTIPRAIRGPGANKNFQNRSKSITNPIPPKSMSKNKGWEHDDRFEDAHD